MMKFFKGFSRALFALLFMAVTFASAGGMTSIFVRETKEVASAEGALNSNNVIVKLTVGELDFDLNQFLMVGYYKTIATNSDLEDVVEEYWHLGYSEVGEKLNGNEDPEDLPETINHFKIEKNGDILYQDESAVGVDLLNGEIVSKKNTFLEVELVFKGGGEYNHYYSYQNDADDLTYNLQDAYYIKELQYKTGRNFYEVDSTSLNQSTGNVYFTSGIVPNFGYISRTINGDYAFSYKLIDSGLSVVFGGKPDASGNFAVEAGGIPGAFTFDITVESKNFQFYTNNNSIVSFDPGSNGFLGHSKVVINCGEATEGLFNIVDTVTIKSGNDVVLTLYGGMCYEDDGDSIIDDDEYFFSNDGASLTTKVAYSNYAFAYSAENDENYISYYNGNSIQIEREEKLENDDYIMVSINDKGVITIYLERLDKKLDVEVTTISCAIFSFYIQESGGNLISSEAFREVEVNGKVYSEGEIPEKIIVVDYSSDFVFKATLKNGYSFATGTDFSFVNALEYSRRISLSGTKLNLVAFENNACSFNVNLFVQYGELFGNADTEIYLSTRPEVDSIDDFTIDEKSITSGNGKAEFTVSSGTSVKVYIKISPYYVMHKIISIINGVFFSDGDFSDHYATFNMVITENTTLNMHVESFVMEKSVVNAAGDEIGTIQISFYNFDGPNCIYEVGFKPVGEYDFYPVTKSNPLQTGYDFKNISLGGVGILTYDGSNARFIISPSDTDLHKKLATDVWNEPELVAEFAPQLKDYVLQYKNGATIEASYNLRFYYDSDEIYLDREFSVRDLEKDFKYFAGFLHEGIEFLTDGEVVPVRQESGEFAGWYMYKMAALLQEETNDLIVEAITKNKTFTLTVQYYFQPTEGASPMVDPVDYAIVYATMFNIDELNDDLRGIPDFYGEYDFIGWKIITESGINYFIDQEESEVEIDFDNSSNYVYDYTGNITIVPVFAANAFMVNVYDRDNTLLYRANVRYNQRLTVESVLKKDGAFLTPPYCYGYLLLGFFDSPNPAHGNLIFSYSDADPDNPYSVSDAGVQDNITSLTPWFYYDHADLWYRWNISEDINIYAGFDADFITLTIDTTNIDLKAESTVVEIEGSNSAEFDWEIIGNQIIISNFFITDVITISKLNTNPTSYISEFVFQGSPIYRATCLNDGTIREIVDNGLRDFFTSGSTNTERLTAGKLTINVGEFFVGVEDGTELELSASLTYEKKFAMFAFVGGVFDERLGDEYESYLEDIPNLVTSGDYSLNFYKVYFEDADVNKSYNWVVCNFDITGFLIGGLDGALLPDENTLGWQPVVVPNTSVTLTADSLFGGDPSLKVLADDGRVLSFKCWRDPFADIDLAEGVNLKQRLFFGSVFSDDFDLKINYYTFNKYTNKYVLNSYDGYFWRGAERAEIITMNSYESYIINGISYYISGWVENPANIGALITTGAAYDLNMALNIYNEGGSRELNYYAKYDIVQFDLNDTPADPASYELEFSLPNDAKGNDYSDDECVEWISLSNVAYAGFGGSVSLADFISYYFNNPAHAGEDYNSYLIRSGATAIRGTTITKSQIAGAGLSDTAHVFAVVRKNGYVGGVYIYAACYIGQVGDLKS